MLCTVKTRPGTDCDSDHKLLIAKFRLKLKKVGKTTRPFRYDLNQILYDYTVEVTNRFKGLDLIDRVPEKRWTKVSDIKYSCIVVEPPPSISRTSSTLFQQHKRGLYTWTSPDGQYQNQIDYILCSQR